VSKDSRVAIVDIGGESRYDFLSPVSERNWPDCPLELCRCATGFDTHNLPRVEKTCEMASDMSRSVMPPPRPPPPPPPPPPHRVSAVHGRAESTALFPYFPMKLGVHMYERSRWAQACKHASMLMLKRMSRWIEASADATHLSDPSCGVVSKRLMNFLCQRRLHHGDGCGACPRTVSVGAGRGGIDCLEHPRTRTFCSCFIVPVKADDVHNF
jgi:hypothetical protein